MVSDVVVEGLFIIGEYPALSYTTSVPAPPSIFDPPRVCPLDLSLSLHPADEILV